ncbi:FadR/GntR family transcriptional regulator [Rhodococcus qingshengii]|uniref:FadR/GntR family transcriptional regulator n=1 Tax=Rhodococcus qingshengii TaxID=334542 RepID=UPI0036DA3B76
MTSDLPTNDSPASGARPLGDRRKFAPARRVRAYESIVKQIEDAIFRGDLRPGQRLPSERDLTVEFAVSRATVREALRVLESSGLVKSRHGDPTGGAEVQEFSPDGLHKSLTAMVHLEQFDLTDLVQFRMAIEGSATFLAAVGHTEEQLQKMDDAHQRMSEAIGRNFEEFSAADVEFHHTVAEAANSGLLRVTNDVARGVVANLIETKFAAALNTEELMNDSCRRHERVLEAIRERDGQKASRLAQHDILDHFGRFLPKDRMEQLKSFASHRPMG